MSLQDNVKSGLLTGGCFASPPASNEPTQYKDKRHEYFARTTRDFTQANAKYSSDYIEGTLEVAQPDGSVTMERVTGRFANVVTPTSSITRKYDDYKNALFDQQQIGYVRPGSKLTTMGSVWLAVNPDNISSPVANGVFRRCNAVWNHLDYYGNVVSEPIIRTNDASNADAPDAQTDQKISVGYFTIICQYNEFTRQINDNTRLILGSKAYQVTGYADFEQEFTGDYSSVCLLTFHVRVLTSNDETDDMEKHVAGGKAFSWEGFISGPEEWGTEYGDAYYNVETTRNGVNIAPTVANPYHYDWSVDDETVAQIEPIGSEGLRLTALQNGTVTITATLHQNPAVSFQKTVKVEAAKNCVRFVKTGPVAPLEPYQSVTLTAYAYDDSGGVDDGVTIHFTASGAAQGSYCMTTVSNNTVEIACYGYSETPLTVTAESSGLTDSVQIELLGW